MPVVVDPEALGFAVGTHLVRHILRGALPEFVVQRLGGSTFHALADAVAVAVLVDHAARVHHLADDGAIVQQLHVADEGGVAAALGAVLHNAVVFLRGEGDLLRLVYAVGGGLLDVHVLASLASPHGGEGVPVVGGGYGDGVHVGVLHQLAHVCVGLGRGALCLLHHLRTGAQHAFVHVAKGGVLNAELVFIPEQVADVRAALAVEPDGGHVDAVVCTPYAATGFHAAHDYRSGGGRHEFTSRDFHRVCLLLPGLAPPRESGEHTRT